MLQADGKVSPNFTWLDPERTDDPRTLLEAEGVTFDRHGRAAAAQRLIAEELALLIGADVPDLIPEPDPGQDAGLRDQFQGQLVERQGPDITRAVVTVLTAWVEAGGYLEYGVEKETSCFLMARGKRDQGGNIWPAVIYPSGKFEVVFQHLSRRSPFNDLAQREELRQRLNKIDGVDLPAAKIDLRPGFDLSILANSQAREQLTDALGWFHDRAHSDGLIDGEA
uniref:Uncharacterized protein n=1 Tax=Kibdelosporangium sp. AK-AA56 TaxID=1962669 RepID=A0A1Y1DCD4_9PSEU|nr:hypothetical protein [Kibdelosporangium sp. AK-AA56]